LSSAGHRAAKIAKLVVPLVVIFFVGRVILNNWEQVRAAEWDIRPGYLALSFLLSCAWFIFRPYGWNVILNGFGRPVPFPAVFRVCRQAELSRYVPGGVWQFVSRVVLLREWGVTAAACLAATIVDLFLATLASLPPAAWTLQEAFEGFKTYHRIVLFAFPFVSLLVVHPKLLNGWAGFLSKKLRQPWTPLDIRWRTLLGIWSLYVLGWLMLGAGVSLFVYGVLRVPEGNGLYIGSSYTVAWLVGTLTMIAPGGMGIREGALGLLLSQILPTGPAFTLAVGIRLWTLLVEIATYGLGYLMPSPTETSPMETEP
jgi:uncharacterized membrane protein YbhN (UPF0104 family)